MGVLIQLVGVTTRAKNKGRGIMIPGYLSADGALAVDHQRFKDAQACGYQGCQDTTEYFQFGGSSFSDTLSISSTAM